MVSSLVNVNSIADDLRAQAFCKAMTSLFTSGHSTNSNQVTNKDNNEKNGVRKIAVQVVYSCLEGQRPTISNT